MHDFGNKHLKSATETLQLASFFEDSSAANGIMDKIKEIYPNSLGFFMQNCADHLDSLRGKMERDELDTIFNYMVNNFVFVMHLLDIANNGEEKLEDIPDETPNSIVKCQFGRDGRDFCENKAIATIDFSNAKVPLCRNCVDELLEHLFWSEGAESIIGNLDNDEADFLLSKIISSFPDHSNEVIVEEIFKGKLEDMQ